MIPCLNRIVFVFVLFFIFQGKIHNIKDWTYSFANVAAFNKTSFIMVNNIWQKILASHKIFFFRICKSFVRNELVNYMQYNIKSGDSSIFIRVSDVSSSTSVSVGNTWASCEFTDLTVRPEVVLYIDYAAVEMVNFRFVYSASDGHVRWWMRRLMSRNLSACLFGERERRCTAQWYENSECRRQNWRWTWARYCFWHCCFDVRYKIAPYYLRKWSSLVFSNLVVVIERAFVAMAGDLNDHVSCDCFKGAIC